MMRFVVALCVLILIIAAKAQAQPALQWNPLPSLPGTPGVASPFAGYSREILLVAGGANFPDAPPWKNGTKVWHETVYGLDDNQWKILGRLPAPCAYGVSFQTHDGILCVGGSNARNHTADVYRMRWKPEGLEFEMLPPLPRPIANACGAVSGDMLFLAGGTDSPSATSALTTFYSMDLKISPAAWRELPAVPGPGRILAVAAATTAHFYVFSGATLSAGTDGKPVRTYLSDAWRFDISKGRWGTVAELPFPAVAAPSPAPITTNGQIVILGGDDGKHVGFQPPEKHPGFPHRALVYTPETDHWNVEPELRISRVTVPAVKSKHGYIIPSGEERPGIRSAEVWELSLD